MYALRRLALTKSDISAGLYEWPFLCTLSGLSAGVVTGASVPSLVAAGIKSTLAGLVYAIIYRALGRRERTPLSGIFLFVAACPHLGDADFGLFFKWELYSFLFLWPILLARRRLVNPKKLPAEAGSPLWDADLDRAIRTERREA